MKSQEINEYVYHYLTKDKTHSAIMLSGEWGIGKSYYVKNDLIPYLEKNEKYCKGKNVSEHQKFHCVLVSLYGLSNITEISKNIYYDARTSFVKNSVVVQKLKDNTSEKTKAAGKEILALGKGCGKSIIKSLFGHEINMSDETFNSLLKTINMEGKLLILEDIERTKIDIIELLGYINSLVEQDNVKVLLIANEDKFIQYETEGTTTKKDEEDTEKTVYIDKTKEYLEKKEKTISDTIYYEADLASTVKQIIMTFNDGLSAYTDQVHIDAIVSIIEETGIYNFRSFIFACQKTVDIFERIRGISDLDFLRCVFYSTIAFSLKMKNSTEWEWTERSECSFQFGTQKYPLFRFCYDYILFHVFDKNKAKESVKILNELRFYDKDKSRDDPDLKTIYGYYLWKENEVRKAIASVENKLRTDNIIAFSEYGRLALYLIHISHILQMDIQDTKTLMIRNLRGRASQVRPEVLYEVNRKSVSQAAFAEYDMLRDKMINALLNQEGASIYGFDYTIETIKQLYDTVTQNEDEIRNHGFMNRMDIPRLIKTMKGCSSKDLVLIKNILNTIYKSDLVRQDERNLTEFKNELDELISYSGYDGIQRYLIGLLIEDIKGYLNR